MHAICYVEILQIIILLKDTYEINIENEKKMRVIPTIVMYASDMVRSRKMLTNTNSNANDYRL